MAETAENLQRAADRIVANKNDIVAIYDLAADAADLAAQLDKWYDALIKLDASGNLSVRETRKLRGALTNARDATIWYTKYLADRLYDIEHSEARRAETSLLKARINGATPEQIKAINALLNADEEAAEATTEPAPK